MSSLTVRHVSKRFGNTRAAVDVNLTVAEGELFALLGPSACGKTTLLRLIAGLEEPDSGSILVGGAEMVGVAVNERPINMVFQSYALFPYMSVADNVSYGLRVLGMARNEGAARVAEALSLVRLGGLEYRRPDTLSGGQRQRVALARALVKRPKVLLLDEPLSALDAKLRDEMGQELVRLQKTLGIAFVLVTHDQDEALSMADRVAVMDHGRICQVAPPRELYERPASRFVAAFLGTTNMFEGQIVGREGDAVMIEVAGLGCLAVPHAGDASGRITLVLRPEKLLLADAAPASGPRLQGQVRETNYRGDHTRVTLNTAAGPVVMTAATTPAIGETVWLCWDAADMRLLVEET